MTARTDAGDQLAARAEVVQAGARVTLVGAAPASDRPVRILGVVAVADASRLVVHLAASDAVAALDRTKPVVLDIRGGGSHESRLVNVRDVWATFERPAALEVTDARQTARTPVEMLPAEIRVQGETAAAYVLDVSPRGLKVMVEYDPRIRRNGTIDVTVDGDEAGATVRHAHRVGSSLLMHLGLEVVGDDDRFRSSLLRLARGGRPRPDRP